MKKIALLQRVIPHYRIEFYEILDEKIGSGGPFSLDVYYGQQRNNEGLRELIIKNNNFIEVKNYYLLKNLYYQFVYNKILSYDYIIIEQAVSPVINWLLMFRKALGCNNPKLFLWGHGKQFNKTKENKILTYLRFLLTKNSDWMFGYTTITKNVLIEQGYNGENISVINNSLSYEIKENINYSSNNFKNYNIVYCGRLYENKKIELIIDSVKISRKKNKKINLYFIGDGPERDRIKNSRKFKWLHFIGSKYGQEKRKILSNCALQILPSHIGLSILDCFASGLPIITSDLKNHCPEYAYFEHGYNGLSSSPNKEAIAQSITYIFDDYKLWKKLSRNSIETAKKYNIQSMAENFYKGIKDATK